MKIIAVSRHRDFSIVQRMLDAGAAGYLLKHSAAELPEAVRAVAAGGCYMDEGLDTPTAAAIESSGAVDERLPADTLLDSQEEQVLRLVAAYQSNNAIASELGVSVDDVIDMKARAMQKAGLQSRIQVIAYAHARGWDERF